MKKYFTLAAMAAIVASCSNSDIPQVDSLKDTPITVSAMVGELATRAGYETNAEDASKSVLPEKFYMKIDQAGEDYDYNVLMTYESNKWVAYDTGDNAQEITLLWASGTDNVTVTAATYSLAEETTLAVETDQSTEDALKASDHLYYTNSEVTPSPDGISVAFNHQMAKVDLTITLGTEFDYDTNPISGLTIAGITPLSTGYTKPAAQYEVILKPQTVNAGTFTVSFKVDDRVFSWTSTAAVTLERGYKYTLALTAGKDKVSGASFTAVAWNTGNNLTGATE